MRLTERLFDLFRTRSVSLYLEWEANEDEDAILAFLRRAGAQNVWVDGDADIENAPSGGIVHAHSVFRFRIAKELVFDVMSAVASHPLVYSASIV